MSYQEKKDNKAYIFALVPSENMVYKKTERYHIFKDSNFNGTIITKFPTKYYSVEKEKDEWKVMTEVSVLEISKS